MDAFIFNSQKEMKSLKFLKLHLAFLLLFNFSVNSQIILGNAFLQVDHVEIGVNQHGVFGSSTAAPTGYHPKTIDGSLNLGFVADPEKNGWTVGNPAYYGDFFVPGIPQEGFAVEFNGTTYRNFNSGTFNIPGANISHNTDASGVTSVWQGSVSGLQINQKTIAPQNEVFFVVRVELTNTTAADMNNVYYMRTLDPDNDVTLSTNFATLNSIIYDLPNPQNNTLVSAKGTIFTNCFLGLGTKDCRANSFILTSGLNPQLTRPISDYHNETANETVYSGVFSGDVAIGITYNIGTIRAGETKRIAFTYILNQNDLDVALSQTLSEVFANTTTPVISGNDYTFCEGDLIPMSIKNGEDQVWKWEPAEYFSAPFGENVILTVPSETVNFIITGISECSPVTYNFSINPSVFEVELNERYHVICSGSSTNYNPMNGVSSPTSTISWYDAPTGGNLLGSSFNFTTPVLINTNSIPVDYVYYFQETNTTGCVSERIPFRVKVYESLNIPNFDLKACTIGSELTAFNLLDYQNIIEPIANASFTYYASLTDLANNIPISNPENYTNIVNNQIIYVQIEVNAFCIDVAELTLRVFDQIIVTPTQLQGCDIDFDNNFDFDLTISNTVINGNADSQFSYFLTLSNAQNNLNPITNFTNYTNVINPQIIYVKVSNPNCSSITELKLEVFAKPEYNFGILNDCEENLDGSANFDLTNAQAQFSPDNTNSYNYATSLSNLENNILITNVTNYVNISNPQIIYVEGITLDGCRNKSELTLTVLPVNKITITDFNKCDDDYDGQTVFNLTEKEAEMNLVLPADIYTYTYHLSELNALNGADAISSNFTNTLTPEQTIYVKAKGTGCPYIISFKIIVLLKPNPIIPATRTLCKGGTIVVNAGSNFDAYLWSTGETTQTINISTPGIYTVTVSNSFGTFMCSTTKSIDVIASDIAIITDVQVADFTNNDNSLNIMYDGIGDYEFSLNGIDYQDSPIFENLESGLYTVFVKDKNGCGIVDKDVYVLMYPNYFTPNGDGINDFWNIKFSSQEPDITVSIFDRYGKLLNVITGAGYGWDGTYNGEQLSSSDYWFVVTRKDGKEIKGHFTLKR